jgi:hypothetical protein
MRRLDNIKEFVIVGAVMTLILLPVRLLFVEFVSDSTLGSLGLVSVISVLVIVLSKKKKLGRFGQMFERQMFKNTHGKRRILISVMLGLTLSYLMMSLVAIELGNTVFAQQKETVKHHLNQMQIDLSKTESTLQLLSAQNIRVGIFQYVNSVLFDFGEVAIANSLLNDYSRGMLQHFYIVFLVEELEMAGLFIFSCVAFRKDREVCTN